MSDISEMSRRTLLKAGAALGIMGAGGRLALAQDKPLIPYSNKSRTRKAFNDNRTLQVAL